MAFDYKKEYKDLYQPKTMPAIVMVPAMRFVAVDGVGDPNEEGGDYAKAMQLLYGISFTVKMSKKSKKPATVAILDDYARSQGYELDLSDARRHHEIYISDPRRAKPENLKTVIRHPVVKVG